MQSGGWRRGTLTLILGIAGIAFISFFAYWHRNFVQFGEPQIVVFSLAPFVFFMIFLVAGLLNPIMRRLTPSVSLGPREIGIVLCMWLLASAVCYRNMTAGVLGTIGIPLNQQFESQTMRQAGTLGMLKRDLFLSPDDAKEYYDGKGDANRWISPFAPSPLLKTENFRDADEMADRLLRPDKADAYSAFLARQLTPSERDALEKARSTAPAELPGLLAADLNRLIQGPLLYDRDASAKVEISGALTRLMNRLFLEAAFAPDVAESPVYAARHFEANEIRSPQSLAARLRAAQYLNPPGDTSTPEAIANVLNAAVDGPCLAAEKTFVEIKLRPHDVLVVNRLLLDDVYRSHITPLPPSVPWAVWWRPFLFWIPFMLVLMALSWSLVRMMHTEWSRHELLTYPIAEVANSLVSHRPVEAGKPIRAFPDQFYNGVFWAGFALTALIYLMMGLHKWFPKMVFVSFTFERRELLTQFPFLNNYCAQPVALFRGWLWPFMVGLAVLMPTEISFTCWAGYVIGIFSLGFHFLATGEPVTGDNILSARAGMCVAMVLVILYLGRREYARILRRAAGFRRSDDDALRRAAGHCRLFVLSFVALMGLLIYMGLDWLVALLVVCTFSLMVILLARLTAEVGLPWLIGFAGTVRFLPLKLLGAAAIGPTSLVVMMVLRGVLDFDTSNTVAAQATTCGKLMEKREERSALSAVEGPSLFVRAAIPLAMCAAIGAAIFFTLWNSYSFGAQKESQVRSTIEDNLEAVSADVRRLQIEGAADRLDATHGLAKLENVHFDYYFWKFFSAGAVIIGICAFMRLRFAWWPFHPLPLLLVNAGNLSRLYHACFLGWVIKIALVKIGGGEFYTRSKPFFVGVIYGGIVMAGFLICVDAIYFLKTGVPPPRAFSYFS